MNCTYCTSNILDDCLYCPKCGKPTPLSAERSAVLVRPGVPLGMPASLASPAPPDQQEKTAPITVDGLRELQNRLMQANLCRVRGNWSEAVDHCVAVLQADPANASAHILLGDIYADRGRNEDAGQWYRMALELQPDAAVTVKMERAQLALDRQKAKQARNGFRSGGVRGIGAQSGEPPVGTVALMGVSPRLWLRGIAVLSVAFLVISGGFLLGMKNRRAQRSAVPDSLGDPYQVSSIAPPAGGNGALPPARPGGPTIVPGSQAVDRGSTQHEGGTGLAPDSPSQSRSVPTGSPASSASRPASGHRTVAAPSPNIPTASVQNVRPMPRSTDSPAYAVLTGGMRLAKTTSLTGGNEAVLVISSVPVASEQDHFRQNAIRNVYRAARNAFSTNDAATEASVFIQTDLTEKGGEVLMIAHLDRDTALKSDPDTEQSDSLLRHLRSIQWGP